MSQQRIIRVSSCIACPFYGNCSSWNKLTKQQKVYISIGNSVPHDFMLKDCELEEVVGMSVKSAKAEG